MSRYQLPWQPHQHVMEVEGWACLRVLLCVVWYAQIRAGRIDPEITGLLWEDFYALGRVLGIEVPSQIAPMSEQDAFSVELRQHALRRFPHLDVPSPEAAPGTKYDFNAVLLDLKHLGSNFQMRD